MPDAAVLAQLAALVMALLIAVRGLRAHLRERDEKKRRDSYKDTFR